MFVLKSGDQLSVSFLQGFLYMSFDINRFAGSLGCPEYLWPSIQFGKYYCSLQPLRTGTAI